VDICELYLSTCLTQIRTSICRNLVLQKHAASYQQDFSAESLKKTHRLHDTYFNRIFLFRSWLWLPGLHLWDSCHHRRIRRYLSLNAKIILKNMKIYFVVFSYNVCILPRQILFSLVTHFWHVDRRRSGTRTWPKFTFRPIPPNIEILPRYFSQKDTKFISRTRVCTYHSWLYV
jgi:hypothetical protein